MKSTSFNVFDGQAGIIRGDKSLRLADFEIYVLNFILVNVLYLSINMLWYL